jgi:hypothetical protein
VKQCLFFPPANKIGRLVRRTKIQNNHYVPLINTVAIIHPIGNSKIIGIKEHAKIVPNKKDDPVWFSK